MNHGRRGGYSVVFVYCISRGLSPYWRVGGVKAATGVRSHSRKASSMRRCLLPLVSLLFFAPLLPAQERKAGVRVEKDLVYGKGGDAELKLDLAMPKDGEGPFPAIVFIHGGGWRSGNRQQ